MDTKEPNAPEPLIDMDEHGEQDTMLDDIVQHLSALGVSLDDEGLPEIMKEVLYEESARSGKRILRDLKKRLPELVQSKAQSREKFQKRLQRLWGNAFSKLEMMIVCSLGAGENFNQNYHDTAVMKQDYIFYVLVRLHARTILISQEILTLLRAGFAAGAHARWRTLHEIVVVGLFVVKHGQETAERYMLHSGIDSYKAMLQYEQHREALGYEPMEKSEIDAIEQQKEELLTRYGPEFYSDYGWASRAVGKVRPNFTDLESNVGLEHYRPLYRMSGHGIHAGPKGLAFNLGSWPDTGILLVGPSNGGLADPGHSTALSILQMTLALIQYRPKVHDLMLGQMMMQLADEIGDAFHRAQKRWEARAANT